MDCVACLTFTQENGTGLYHDFAEVIWWQKYWPKIVLGYQTISPSQSQTFISLPERNKGVKHGDNTRIGYPHIVIGCYFLIISL